MDIDEVLYTSSQSCCNVDPSNANLGFHNGALLCVTDLVDCCESPRMVRGDWYYPDGGRVLFDHESGNLVILIFGETEVQMKS